MIKELQAEIKAWQDKNFPTATADHMFKGIVEELGELANASLKGEVLGRDTLAKEKDAIGDIYIFLNGYCQKRDFELEDIIKSVWAEVRERDYTKEKVLSKVPCPSCGSREKQDRTNCSFRCGTCGYSEIGE